MRRWNEVEIEVSWAILLIFAKLIDVGYELVNGLDLQRANNEILATGCSY